MTDDKRTIGMRYIHICNSYLGPTIYDLYSLHPALHNGQADRRTVHCIVRLKLN